MYYFFMDGFQSLLTCLSVVCLQERLLDFTVLQLAHLVI